MSSLGAPPLPGLPLYPAAIAIVSIAVLTCAGVKRQWLGVCCSGNHPPSTPWTGEHGSTSTTVQQSGRHGFTVELSSRLAQGLLPRCTGVDNPQNHEHANSL